MILQIAWRNIWRNKTRSIVIALSVAIGLFAGLAVLSLNKGMLKSRIRTVIDAEIGHLQIHQAEFKKDNDPRYILTGEEQWLRGVDSPGTTRAATIRTITQAMLTTATGSSGVQVNGIIPQTENEVSHLSEKIREGNDLTGKNKNEILVSRKLADKLKLKTGSKLVLTFTDTATNIISAAFRVTGIYQTANGPLDERNVYVKKEPLNELLGISDAFHEVTILLQHDADLEPARDWLKSKYPDVQVETWKEISPETALMLNTMDYYMYIIIGIIMLALAFGIINTMLMAVLERTREIGMMVALGMNRIRLFILILLETVFLTLIGTPFGLLLAWLASSYFYHKGIDISSFAGKTMNSFGFDSIIYPEFPGEMLSTVMLIVITTAVLSCLFPAIKAGRLNPIDAIRR